MEQQILNNKCWKTWTAKKDCPLFHLLTSSFLMVPIIFFSQCVFGKILNFYIRIMAHGYCFSNRAFIFFQPGSTFFLPTLILYSSLSPSPYSMPRVPASYLCQVFGVAIFSDELNCFDITNKKTLTKIKMWNKPIVYLVHKGGPIKRGRAITLFHFCLVTFGDENALG